MRTLIAFALLIVAFVAIGVSASFKSPGAREQVERALKGLKQMNLRQIIMHRKTCQVGGNEYAVGEAWTIATSDGKIQVCTCEGGNAYGCSDF